MAELSFVRERDEEENSEEGDEERRSSTSNSTEEEKGPSARKGTWKLTLTIIWCTPDGPSKDNFETACFLDTL
jgi:hypothetical protein